MTTAIPTARREHHSRASGPHLVHPDPAQHAHDVTMTRTWPAHRNAAGRTCRWSHVGYRGAHATTCPASCNTSNQGTPR